MKQIARKVISEFKNQYHATPELLVRAPGRVNLVGDHTDYNLGLVLPLAVELEALLAFRPRTDKKIVLHSLDFNETVWISIQDLGKKNNDWADYIRGTIWALNQEGIDLKGWEGVMGSDIPIGAGLSSSAAIEMAVAYACTIASGLDWHPIKMANVCWRAETNWIGVQSGIMDQMVVGNAKKDHALFIDCRSLGMEPIPLPTEARIAILDTATRRELIKSSYDQRVADCDLAAKTMGLTSLRDLDETRLQQYRDSLDERLFRRSRHVWSENNRVVQVVSALKNNHLREVGELLLASHTSLKNDFEVSTSALNLMVEIAQNAPGCLGARMTGAGFGGCAIALIELNAEHEFSDYISREYLKKSGLTPKIFICSACPGASQVPVS